eukprot:scaffold155_cov347-Pavlova_lutheri.AAC.57
MNGRTHVPFDVRFDACGSGPNAPRTCTVPQHEPGRTTDIRIQPMETPSSKPSGVEDPFEAKSASTSDPQSFGIAQNAGNAASEA